MSFSVGAGINPNNYSTNFNRTQRPAINNQKQENTGLFNKENGDSFNFTNKATKPIETSAVLAKTTEKTSIETSATIASAKKESSIETSATIASAQNTETSATLAMSFGSLTHASSNFSSASSSSTSSSSATV